MEKTLRSDYSLPDKLGFVTVRLMTFVVISLFFHLAASAQTTTPKFTVSIQNELLSTLYLQIEKQSDISFVYQAEDIERLGRKTFRFENETLDAIMARTLQGTGLRWSYRDKHVVITHVDPRSGPRTDNTGQGQGNTTVSGIVTNANGDPLGRVSVMLKGTTLGVMTDASGRFSFTFPQQSDPVIIFSYMGMKTQEIRSPKSPMKVILQEEVKEIGEVNVVYTGYQQLNPRELGSAITSIKVDEIYNPVFSTIDQMLEGYIPGLTFIQSSGQIGASPKLRIRGATTILGSQEPLWVLDGIVIDDPVNISPSELNDLDFVNLLGNAISGLNPEDIEQIDILKDASATALYGKRAAQGVIVITTKKGKPGPPTVTYSLSGTYTPRLRYTNDNFDVMNSLERVALSRELINNGQVYPTLYSWIGYEKLYSDYINNNISYSEYSAGIAEYETMNTDWLDLLTQDAYSLTHTLSLSGGSEQVSYRASVGVEDKEGTVRGEFNKRYTANLQMSAQYKRFAARFGINGYVSRREYEPADLGIMDYALNTSRTIPAYDENGNYYLYDRKSPSSGLYKSASSVYPGNILQDMENSWTRTNGSGANFQANLEYELFPTLKLTGLVAYSFANTYSGTYHGQETLYGRSLRNEYNAPTEEFFYEHSLLPIGGELKESTTSKNSYTVRAGFEYNELFGMEEQHKINFIGGIEAKETKYFTLAQTYRGYEPDRGLTMSPVDVDLYTDYRTWTQTRAALGVRTEQKLRDLAIYMSAGYGYKEHAFFSFSLRSDYSNEFGSRAREKFYPVWAISGRWNMSESVLKNVGWIDDISLRASYGHQGNVPSTSIRLIIEKGEYNRWYEDYGSTIKSIPNASLKWEKTTNINLGFDFSLFDRKIMGKFDFYVRNTKDAYITESVSEVNGVTSQTVNGGSIRNVGFDVELNFMPINTMTTVNGELRGFRWRIDPQIGQVINKILDNATASREKSLKTDDQIVYMDYLNGSIPVRGYPINSFFSYEFAGLSTTDGRPYYSFNAFEYDPTLGASEKEALKAAFIQSIVYDENGNVNSNQYRMLEVMTYSGSRVAKIQGGIYNSLSYNNLTLSVHLAYSFGSKVRLMKLYPDLTYDDGTMAPQIDQNVRRELINRWQKPGDENYTNIPGIIPSNLYVETLGGLNGSLWWVTDKTMSGAGNAISGSIWEMYDYSTARVVSGDYVKIQNISLRYNIPRKICEKLNMKSGYISVGGTNLYTFCNSRLKGQDPTTASSTSDYIAEPIKPIYSLTINVTF